jgi:hypothetical protein
MTELTKPISRETGETRYEKAQHRRLIVSVEPAGRDAAVVGVRLKGTRQTFRIGVQSIYNLAVQNHNAKIERRAKELKKAGLNIRSARSRARKELDKELR